MPSSKDSMRIDVKPTLKQLEQRMAKAKVAITERGPINKKVSILLDAWVQQNFRTEGARAGGWQAFKFPEFGRYITGQGWDPSAKLLQDTGRLKLSFIPFANKTDIGIGSELPYAKYHEEGTSRLPQRRMLPSHTLDKKLIKKIEAMFDRHVVEAFDV